MAERRRMSAAAFAAAYRALVAAGYTRAFVRRALHNEQYWVPEAEQGGENAFCLG